MLDLDKPMEPPMKRRAGLWIVQAGRGSYRGIFWKLKHHDEMILAWEDGFCDILKQSDAMASPVEDLYFKNSNMILSSALTPSLLDGTPGDYLVGYAITEMSHSSHVVGSGVVGEAAVKGNASWIYADSIQTDVLNSILVSEYPDEWLLQFAAGIKTILLLPVIPDGVLQLGSTEMVSEDAVLVAYLKNKFELHKQSDGYNQQISPTSTFMDYLEEPSTVTTETVTEDQNSIHAVEDLYSIENQTVPVFMLHDLYNSSERHVEDNHENPAEGEMNQQPMGMNHVPEPFQLSYADYIDEISKYIHDERLRVSPYSSELNRRMCGDLVNVLMDYKFEEGGTELTCVGNDFDNGICESGSNLFNFHEASGFGKAVGEVIQNKPHENIYGESILSQDIAFHSVGDRVPSGTVDVSGVESVRFLVKHMEVEHLSKTVNANSSSSFDDNSSDKSIITSLNMPSHGFHKARAHSKHSASVESKISSLSDEQQPRKGHDPVNKRKLSRLSTTSKKRIHSGDNQRPRPRDRQLIQDRIKELRELVPNGEKGSIDGLLDKTIKHMLFLRNVTNQADKLRHPILEEEVGDNTTKPAEVKCSHRDGASWAVELGNEQHFCPIIVKDLDHPRHMLIEMVCTDHDRFLEIADVIHRLKLTILKGVMEKSADKSSWARFIVEDIKYVGSINSLVSYADLRKLPSARYILATDATPKRSHAYLN